MSLEYEPFSEPLHSLSPNPRTAIVSEAVTPSFVTDSSQMFSSITPKPRVE